MSFCLSGLSTIYRLQFVNVSMSRIQLQGYRLVSPSILSNKATTFQYSFLTIALLELISALLNIGKVSWICQSHIEQNSETFWDYNQVK